MEFSTSYTSNDLLDIIGSDTVHLFFSTTKNITDDPYDIKIKSIIDPETGKNHKYGVKQDDILYDDILNHCLMILQDEIQFDNLNPEANQSDFFF